jgi:outer membrane protein OmpA-like peptidoglycan-associated protein
MKLKTGPKILLLVAGIGATVMGIRHGIYTGLIPRPNALKALVPLKSDEITATVLDHNVGNVKLLPLPTSQAVVPCMDGNTSKCVSGATLEILQWAWSANGALDYGVGGASGPAGKGKFIQTSKGSLAEKYGVNVHIERQDDSGAMQEALLVTAQKLVNDPNASGPKFVTIMGDGAAQFLAALNPKLQKISPDLKAEMIATIGYSRGEDGFWGPEAWKTNCEAMRGGVVVGVIKDGDWNIALKKAQQCNIPNNPDVKVYDPQALNWINSDSYTNAANDFVKGTACVEIPTKGKINGGNIKHCADAVVTWTPGDVTVAKKRGGVVPILTTEQSAFQMPCTLIGLHRYNQAHRSEIVKLLSATYDAADQIRANPAAKQRMAEVAYTLYNEESPEYWLKYFNGVIEPDAQGIRVHLGGSAVSNLADAMQSFGLSGGPNLLEATYNTFGKIVVQQYPKEVPSFPPTSDVLDTSYVAAVAASGALPTNNDESVLVTKSNKAMGSIEGKRAYMIKFASGSSQILPESIAEVSQLASDVMITNYAVAIHGHTDNTGTPDSNDVLSKSRADAVAAYLRQRGVRNVVRTYAHGQSEPVASNDTAAGKTANRRVVVMLGSISE